jgi:hypothetical protein
MPERAEKNFKSLMGEIHGWENKTKDIVGSKDQKDYRQKKKANTFL